ncbi:MMPL family transporter [Lacisediminihabitans sp. FW035]
MGSNMAGLLYRLGRFSARRHWTVILSWIVIIALAGVGYGLFAGTISSSITIPGTATAKVADQLATKFPKVSGGSGSVVFATDDGTAFSSAEKAGVESLLADIGGFAGVKATTNPFTTEAKLAEQRTQVTDGRAQVEAGKQQLAASQAQLDAGTTQLAAAQQQLDAAKAQAAGRAPAAVLARLAAQQAQIDTQKAALETGQQKITAGATELTAQASKLELGSQLLDLSKNIRFVSKDGSAALATVQFDKSNFAVSPALKAKVVSATEDTKIAGVTVSVSSDISQGIPSVVGPGEIVGLVVAAVVLLVMLGTLLGAALPLLSALVGIAAALLGALAFSGAVQFTSVTPVLALMLGLAVGIDYALFIINRHRSQLKQGMAVRESIGLANGTSGNAVVFAGSTVIVALLALNITGIPFLGLMGTVGAVAVAVAILVAITLTPAMLSLAGMKILSKKERAAIGTATARPPVTRAMPTWRAIVTIVAGIAVLGVIALPAMSMRLGLPDGSSEATSSSQYAAFTTVADKFGPGQNGPLLVVATLPEKATGDALLQQEVTIGEKLAAQKHVDSVAPIGASSDGTVVAFQVIPTGGPSSVSTETLVHDLRDLSPVTTSAGNASLGVAGNASAQIDVSEKLAEVLPIYLAVVVGLSLIILIIVFRSILVPLTATAGFVLSLLATFGAITAIYQFGWLGAVFGVHDPAPILSFLPVIEIGILFGLAMDYQLFLVSGMREAFAHGAPARVAVQQGLRIGRPVVTAAAIIMIAVFSGFIFSESSTIRPIGFGLAFGVLADAFIVRMLLIPAAMHLLGKSAWWLPKWLDRIIPDVDVEGASLERTHPQSHAALPEIEEPARRG